MDRSVRSSSSASSHRSARGYENALDLSVQGCSVTRVSRAPRPKPSQPPNSPSRPCQLPIDVVSQLKTELQKRLVGGCDLSTKAPSIASSHPDLALDLSSVTDSSRDTDRSTTASSCDESEWSEGWTPIRPLLPSNYFSSSRTFPKHQSAYLHRPCERISKLSCSSSSQPTSRDAGSCSHRAGWSCQQSSRRTSTRSHSDLIDVYVETVKNTDLSKFFRPCVTCEQVCCQCPPSPLALRIDLCTTCGRSYCQCPKEAICGCLGTDHCSDRQPTSNHCVMCSPHACTCMPKVLPREVKASEDTDRNSIVSRYLLERRFSPGPQQSPPRQLSEQNGDSGNSTLQLEDSGRDGTHSILSRQHVSLSVMQLATAAQCARILADSLESVLELAKEELTDNKSTRSSVPAVFNHNSLLSAINDLNITDVRSQQPPDETPN